jgi:hypothetical protein
VDHLPEDEWIRSRIRRLRALRRSVLDARAIDELIEEAEERLQSLGAVKPVPSS